MDIRVAIAQGAELLKNGGVRDARLTAQLFLAQALNRDRTYLYTYPERELTTVEWIHFGRYLHERLNGRPVQHILKSAEFYGRRFRVTPDVLIPRPETEHVVERALTLAPSASRVADVCTGSGILAVTLALELKPAFTAATDISAPALGVARSNAAALGANVGFVQCDLMDSLDAPLDLIVANPPYIPSATIETLDAEVRDHDPRIALDGGPDGLDLYRRLIPQALSHLAPGGWLVVEIGYDQGASVPPLFGQGWSSLQVTNDLAGHPRVIEARRS
ncbi:MAG TPA: peptide chain release factor N(5)-glutamine methyltransferase [Bryobacteraceae bacterium]|mgnify:CR=1 FL=1|nr:peptide chain release factor N(5)-glutamine methyltransferase [Bryobacteraceae bacterium]HPT27158.1 peptide chain release factor N(5)-glutamine methyltransferase [Bryobacteraceae bacterium]